MPYAPVLTKNTCYPGLFDVEFSMVNLDMAAIKQKVAEGTAPFKKLVMCNLGNPLAVGQPHITYTRQLVAATVCPSLMGKGVFPADVEERAARFLAASPGGDSGSYQATEGNAMVIQDIADYISKRDGYPCDTKHIFMGNGATELIMLLLRPIIRGRQDAILTPRPGFPLYNATITYYQGFDCPYDLVEDKDWALEKSALESAVHVAKSAGAVPRCLIIINPNNPTGGVQTYAELRMALKFAYAHNMMVIADEVYQDNIYEPERFPFHSVRKVLLDLEKEGECKGLELISVHSASKSVYGECGRRGGYWHATNVDEAVLAQILDVVSLGSTNSDGMVAMDTLVRHPQPGEPSYELWKKETGSNLESLCRKAHLIAEEMNSWEGMSCATPAGALYVYPRIQTLEKAEEAAAAIGKTMDELYCQKLLEEVGVVTLPGSMLGQMPGTYHLRMTILPQEEDIKDLMQRWKAFHAKWYAEYK